MATRKRSMQPSIWQDPDFGCLKPLAQLIFLGCITQADDEGRLVGHPSVIKSTLFPYERVELEDVFEALEELSDKMKNFIYYSVDKTFYIQFKNWKKHQKLRDDRTQRSTYPPPPRRLMIDTCPTDDRQTSVGTNKDSKVSEHLAELKKDLVEKGVLKENNSLKKDTCPTDDRQTGD